VCIGFLGELLTDLVEDQLHMEEAEVMDILCFLLVESFLISSWR